jgi:hypothetical protein
MHAWMIIPRFSLVCPCLCQLSVALGAQLIRDCLKHLESAQAAAAAAAVALAVRELALLWLARALDAARHAAASIPTQRQQPAAAGSLRR